MPDQLSALPAVDTHINTAEATTSASHSTHELSTKAVSLSLSGKLLLDNINLQTSSQGITAIVGYNGAGKSLLLRVLHGLITPSSGAVLLAGKPLNRQQRLRQAMVFQKPVMLRRTVIDNIKFVLNARDVPASEVADRAQHLLLRVGLESLAKQAARRLSGGEQQRLSLARALATEPKMLFLDEATANLDPASTRWIESVVSDVAIGGTKVIMVTHDLAQVRRLSEEVVYLENGRICTQGFCEAFFEQAQHYETTPELTGVSRFLRGELPPPHNNQTNLIAGDDDELATATNVKSEFIND